MDIQTLFVVPCRRDPRFSQDIVSSIRWSVRGTHDVVIASFTAKPPGVDGWFKAPVATRQPGFWCNQAIARAIERGVAFQYAVVVSDESLVVGVGIDEWVHSQLQPRPKVGLLGVGDAMSYETKRVEVQSFMLAACRASKISWERIPTGLCDDFLVLPYRTAKQLYDRGMLVPQGHERMPFSYGSYMSFAVSMLGLPIMVWSDLSRPRPPLYVNRTWTYALSPSPRILSADFLFYSSLVSVQGYTEDQVRTECREGRNEVEANLGMVRDLKD